MLQARTQDDLLQDLQPDDLDEDLDIDGGTLSEDDLSNGDNLQEALISMGVDPDEAADMGRRFVPKSAYTKGLQESQSQAQQAVALAQQIQQQTQAGGGAPQKPLDPEEQVKKFIRESAGDEVDEGTVQFLENFADQIIQNVRSEQQRTLAPVIQTAQDQAIESQLSDAMKEMSGRYGSDLKKVWPDVVAKTKEYFRATGQWYAPEQILWHDYPEVAAALKTRHQLTKRRTHREEFDPGILEGGARMSTSEPMPLAQGRKRRERDMSPAAVTKRAMARLRKSRR